MVSRLYGPSVSVQRLIEAMLNLIIFKTEIESVLYRLYKDLCSFERRQICLVFKHKHSCIANITVLLSAALRNRNAKFYKTAFRTFSICEKIIRSVTDILDFLQEKPITTVSDFTAKGK